MRMGNDFKLSEFKGQAFPQYTPTLAPGAAFPRIIHYLSWDFHA